MPENFNSVLLRGDIECKKEEKNCVTENCLGLQQTGQLGIYCYLDLYEEMKKR